MEWWILGSLAALVLGSLVVLSVEELGAWFREHRTPMSAYGTIVRDRLASGNYRVVTGIFDDHGICESTAAWEIDDVDEGLEAMLDRDGRAVVEIWD